MQIEPSDVHPDFVDLLLDAVLLVDAQGRLVHITAASERIFGYAPVEMIGRSMIEFLYPEDREKTLAESKLVMAGHPRIGFENRYVHKDGRLVHIMWSARWSEADQMRIGVARDVTQRKLAEARQSATYAISEAAQNAADVSALSRDIYRIVAELIPLTGFAVAVVDSETGRLDFPYQTGDWDVLQDPSASRCCTEVLGLGKPIQLAAESRTSETTCRMALPLVTSNKSVGVLMLSNREAYSSVDAEFLHFISAQIATAIERKQLHAELIRAARYDELTGLPNRRLLYDRIRSALARARRNQSTLALLYVDIDDFKLVNDSFGHAAGDVFLQEVAARLQGCLREADTVSRVGGDEFVVLLEDVRDADGANAIVEKIKSALSRKMVANGPAVALDASVGIAIYPGDGTDAEQLLLHADRKMYLHKRKRSRVPGAE
ncbi:diguanylate cyclase domain-containing protein [Lacisediminimonas sp.]|uniref:diguanylate cyclase domain-containing protein n=1 Tax=Lacisediminimonas sp. TaxID=3060582 RepID=UPI00271F241F|nr:diguanylate cyclase [Lacisediminimonas sp.]MDO8300699.1 diguanylate cyclase [Lacisediminimonas sp.]